jgi:hypothetical protein
MSGRALLRAASPPFDPEWGKNGALRQKVGKDGRVHIDRWLPFVILHRGDEDPDSIARRVAVNSPSYMVWEAADDHAALSALGPSRRGFATSRARFW